MPFIIETLHTDLIANRIQALRPYISGRRMNMIMARQDMDSINKDRKEMLTSVFLFYAITYPDFVKVLADAGMTSCTRREFAR